MRPLSTSITSTPCCLPPARTRLVTLHLGPSKALPASSELIPHSFTETLRVASVSRIETSIDSGAIILPPVNFLQEQQQIAAHLESSTEAIAKKRAGAF